MLRDMFGLCMKKPTKKYLGISMVALFGISIWSFKVEASPSSPPPSVVTDTLANGLRYYIHSNKSPSKRAFLWLAVNAGSINEDNDQKGFAHFLEHMAFNGTRNFPGNKLIDVIEEAGMSFGPDLNAYTSFDETVYQLTIPTDDSVLLNSGLQIIEDWASGNILNDSLEVVGERGVVLGEWRMRLRDSASERFQREMLERIFGVGSKYIDRLPIGDPELLRTANPAEIKRFYNDWYRPDLMAVIAVGDFDAVEMEREIRQRFGRIPRPTNPRHFVRPVIERASQTTVQLVRDQVQPKIDFMWSASTVNSDARSMIREDLLRQLAVPYIQRSISSMAKQQRRPFASGFFDRVGGLARPLGQNYQLSVSAHPDSLMYGFSQILTEIQRVSEHGIPLSILNRQKGALMRWYEGYADGSAAISSRVIAQKYVNHYLQNQGVLLSPKEHLKIVKDILPAISNLELAQFVSRWKGASQRLVVVSIPKFSTLRFLEEREVVSLLDSIAQMHVSVAPATSQQDVQLQSIGVSGNTSGFIKAGDANPDIGIHRFQLSNGARVVLKSTYSNPDEVIIHAQSPGGHSLLPDSLFFSPGRLVTALMTASGGLGERSREELEKGLSSTGVREFRVELNAFNEEMRVRGSPRELEIMFQMMYMQFVDPTVDTLALSEWRRTGFSTLRMSQNDMNAVQIGKHRRLAPPQRAGVPFIDIDQAMRIYRDRFGDASDFTFFIVGATDSQQVAPLIERYLASLPSSNREARETPRSFGIITPLHRSITSMDHPNQNDERAQMSLSFIGDISGETAYQARLERIKIQALSLVLSRRLRNKLREEMAVTYNAGASVIFYSTPEERYALGMLLTTAPNMIDTSIVVVWEEIRSLYKEGPSQEELDIALTILERRLENSSQSNEWWVAQLIAADNSELLLDTFRELSVPKLTSEDIREAAVKYMPENIYNQATLKPIRKPRKDLEKETQG